MAGIGDSLFNLWQPDPEQAIGQWSDAQQAANRKAIGLDASGNPLPAAPDGGDQGAAQAQASSTLPAGQEPNATKTPVSLGHLLMNLQQRNEADQGLNQSLGMGFAAFAQPRDREMVSKMFNQTQPDVNAIGQTQMNLGMQQQGQDRMNALGQIMTSNDPRMLAQAQQIAKSLNIPLADLKARYLADPQGVGNMIQSYRSPTDPMKNLQQISTLGAGAAASPEMNDIKSGVVSSIAGPENAAMISAQAAWRNAHKGQPDSAMPWAPNDLAAFRQWQTTEAGKEADRQTASSELVDKNEGAQTLQDDLTSLKNSPGLHSIMTTPGKRDIALSALNDPNATDVPSMMKRWALSNDEANAVALLRRIGGATTETAMRGMAGTGTRVTQAEVGPLKDAISMTQNLNQSYEDYVHGAINNAMTKTKRAIAANYGNTGNVSNMPAEYQPWLNDTFKKGGQLYKEGSGADDIAPAQPVPDSEIAQGKAVLADKPYLKNEMLDNWQQRGLDTTKLRSSSPSSW